MKPVFGDVPLNSSDPRSWIAQLGRIVIAPSDSRAASTTGSRRGRGERGPDEVPRSSSRTRRTTRRCVGPRSTAANGLGEGQVGFDNSAAPHAGQERRLRERDLSLESSQHFRRVRGRGRGPTTRAAGAAPSPSVGEALRTVSRLCHDECLRRADGLVSRPSPPNNARFMIIVRPRQRMRSSRSASPAGTPGSLLPLFQVTVRWRGRTRRPVAR